MYFLLREGWMRIDHGSQQADGTFADQNRVYRLGQLHYPLTECSNHFKILKCINVNEVAVCPQEEVP